MIYRIFGDFCLIHPSDGEESFFALYSIKIGMSGATCCYMYDELLLFSHFFVHSHPSYYFHNHRFDELFGN